jgi:hypothetical protein
MQLDIGGTVAKCFSCGSKEFASLRPSVADGSDRLACVQCCTEVAYDDLLSQIYRTAYPIGSTPSRTLAATSDSSVSARIGFGR